MSPETINLANSYLNLIRQQQEDFEGLSRGQKSVRTKNQAKFDSVEQAQAYLKYHEAMKEIETLKNDNEIENKLRELDETPWSANPIYSIYNNGELSTKEAYEAKRRQSDAVAAFVSKNIEPSLFSQIAEKGSPCSRPPEKRANYCSTAGEERKQLLQERGRAILSNYLMFDMKDPVSGEITSWRDLQPDHVIAQSKAGTKADASTNLNIVYGAYNQVKKAGEWESVKKSLEKVSTLEGFNMSMSQSDAKAEKKARDQRKHYDNLRLIKGTEKAGTYLNDSIDTPADAQNFLRGLAASNKNVSPSNYRAPRPFREASRGSSTWGSKEGLVYINKKLLGLESEITEREREKFLNDLQRSNAIREKDPKKKIITEESILQLYK